MDVRRVQITGGSSYVVTLPKEWIKSLNIKKNDPLSLFIQSDGTLLITSKIVQGQHQKIKRFDVTSPPKDVDLLRHLIGAYIAGFTSIQVSSQTKLPTSIRNVIRSFTQLTIGQEVVEETDTSILLKDLLNPSEMPLDRTIKRMHIIVRGMYEDATRALQTKDKNLAKELLTRDNELDRLHWLIARQYNIIIQNVSLSEKMSISLNMASTCFMISRIIERIGDHLVRIAENVPTLIDSRPDAAILDRILFASSESIEVLNKSVTAFFRNDIKAADEAIDGVTQVELDCEEIKTLALRQKGLVAITVGIVVDSIRRIGEYSQDIAENVINHAVLEN